MRIKQQQTTAASVARQKRPINAAIYHPNGKWKRINYYRPLTVSPDRVLRNRRSVLLSPAMSSSKIRHSTPANWERSSCQCRWLLARSRGPEAYGKLYGVTSETQHNYRWFDRCCNYRKVVKMPSKKQISCGCILLYMSPIRRDKKFELNNNGKLCEPCEV